MRALYLLVRLPLFIAMWVAYALSFLLSLGSGAGTPDEPPSLRAMDRASREKPHLSDAAILFMIIIGAALIALIVMWLMRIHAA